MVDCGYRKDPYWRPSIHFWGQSIDVLILTNLDEDHVADFKDLRRNVRIGSIWINDSIDATRLYAMKAQGMQSGVESVYEYLRQPVGANLPIDLTPMKVSLFRNTYGAFNDTNNLSLVTFVEYGWFSIVYPGDLETKGWESLLTDPAFRAHLGRVSLFVTSHHGRESGCCDEVFDVCFPEAFLISDKEVVHDTQDVGVWYRSRCRGLTKILRYPWEQPEKRYVFTTRNDRCMSIDVDILRGLILTINSNRQ